MRLTPATVLDLEATLHSGQAFRWRREGASAHVGFIDGHKVRLEVRHASLDAQASPAIGRARVEQFLRLDGSHEQFLGSIHPDALLAEALGQYQGMRVLRQDPWETLIAFLVSQNSNGVRIAANIESIAEAATGSRRAAFPSAAQVARLSVGQLRRAGLGYRAEYVGAAAKMVAEGTLVPPSWPSMGYDDAFQQLITVPGVGAKVADCVLLYGCGHLDAVPVDVWIRRLVDRRYYRGPRRTAPYDWVRQWARRRYGRFAGYAQHYWFHWMRSGAPASLRRP